VIFSVDHVPDVSRELTEEQDAHDDVHVVRPHGGQLVPHDRGLVATQSRVIQQAGGLLRVAETVGADEDVLQLRVRVRHPVGVVAEVAYGVHERDGQLGHGHMELGLGVRDVGDGKRGGDAPEPCLRRLGAIVG